MIIIINNNNDINDDDDNNNNYNKYQSCIFVYIQWIFIHLKMDA